MKAPIQKGVISPTLAGMHCEIDNSCYESGITYPCGCKETLKRSSLGLWNLFQEICEEHNER